MSGSYLMAIVLPDEIRTVRLILCQLHPGDAAAIFYAYTQDLEVARYMVWQPRLSISETEDFISYCCQAWASGEARPYILTLQGGQIFRLECWKRVSICIQ